MRLLGALVPSFGIPLLLAAWARLRALRRGGEDPARSWFAYAQQLGGIALLGWLMWLTLAPHWIRETLRPIEWRLPPLGTMPLFTLALLAPPALLGVTLALLQHEAARRFRGLERSWSLALRDAWLQFAMLAVPLPIGLAALPAFASGHRALGAALGVGAAAALALLMARRRALSGIAPHAVMSGELRDRVFAIAASARVELQHLYVVPFRSQRLANAFAVQHHTVVLTDYLIEQLGKDELDAVLAHEMAHLQLGHPRQLGLAVVLTAAIAGTAIALGGNGLLAPVLLVLGVLGVMAHSRRIEYAADRRALELGARPEALITGLSRLCRLNHVPARWSSLREWSVTHPSTERRAMAIARAANLDPASAADLLHHPPASGTHYALPSALAADRVFTTSFKTATNLRIVWSMLAVMAIVPALLVAIEARLAMSPAIRLVAPAVFAIVALALGQIIARRISAARMRALEGAATAPLSASLPPGARGRFLGLSPALHPRIYESFTVWDVGLLALEPGRLDWSGEEARFTLAASDVRRVSVVRGFPGWQSRSNVLIQWERPDGLRGVFRLSIPENAHHGRREARDLAAWIEAWRLHPDGERSASPRLAPWLGAPPTLHVTSASPRAAIGARAMIATWIVLALLSIAASAALGLPFGFGQRAGLGDALFATLASHALLIAPLLRYREPASEGAPAAESQRRAA